MPTISASEATSLANAAFAVDAGFLEGTSADGSEDGGARADCGTLCGIPVLYTKDGVRAERCEDCVALGGVGVLEMVEHSLEDANGGGARRNCKEPLKSSRPHK